MIVAQKTKPLYGIALADYRYRRRARRENFGRSAKHTSDKIYRCAAKYSRTQPMSRTKRELLVRMVNLAIRRGYNAALSLSLTDLARRGGMSLNSARSAIRWITSNGWARMLRAGRGRGNVSVYQMDLPAMMRSLAPDMAVAVGGEFVSIQGEIGEVAKRCKNAGAYIKDKTQRLKSGWVWRVRYASTIGFAETVVNILAGKASAIRDAVSGERKPSELAPPASKTTGGAQYHPEFEYQTELEWLSLS